MSIQAPGGAIREDFKICNCTNTQLERGDKTCGLPHCPNHPDNQLPRPDTRGEGK